MVELNFEPNLLPIKIPKKVNKIVSAHEIKQIAKIEFFNVKLAIPIENESKFARKLSKNIDFLFGFSFLFENESKIILKPKSAKRTVEM